MNTNKDTKSCMPCHQNHNKIAGMVGDDCSKCHKADDPYGRKTVPWPRLLGSTFDHWSVGHKDWMDEQTSRCAECHTQVKDAKTLDQVKIPTEARAACMKCHVADRQRFHWQGVGETEPK